MSALAFVWSAALEAGEQVAKTTAAILTAAVAVWKPLRRWSDRRDERRRQAFVALMERELRPIKGELRRFERYTVAHLQSLRRDLIQHRNETEEGRRGRTDQPDPADGPPRGDRYGGDRPYNPDRGSATALRSGELD